MRLGIFGGSFDPVHDGHLALARACQHEIALDEIWFMPTAVQPLKHRGPHATDLQRVEMLRLAIEAESTGPGTSRPEQAWRVCTLEIDRGGVSYTIDTVRQLHEELPDAELYFMIGSDVLRDVIRWKEPREIFRLATPLVVHRAGESEPDLAALDALCPKTAKPRLILMPAAEISSTEIRRRVAAGEPIEQFVPPAVAAYIAENGVY